MRRSHGALVLCLLAATACGGGGDGGPPAGRDGDAAQTVSFARDVAPVFTAKCVLCHHPDNAVMVDLTAVFDPEVGLIERPNTWTQAEATLLVDPGNVDNSFLIDKIARDDLEHAIEGDPMPLMLERLTRNELSALRRWIEAGAADDASFREEIALIFGDGVSLGRSAGKCAFCHYPGQFPDLVDPFDSERGAVSVMGTAGVLIVPGDADGSVLYRKVADAELDPSLGAPMPLHLPAVTDEEVARIEAWIEAGAPDN